MCLAYSSVLGSQSAIPWLPGTILFRSFENNGIPISERTPLYSGLIKWPPVKLTKWCVHMWILGRRHPMWQRNTYFYFYNPTVSYIFLAAAWLQKSLSFLHFADTRLCFPSLKHILTRDLIYTVPRATHPARQFWVSQYVVNLDLLAPTLGDSGEPITHFWTLSVASWMSPRYTTYALILEPPPRNRVVTHFTYSVPTAILVNCFARPDYVSEKRAAGGMGKRLKGKHKRAGGATANRQY